MQSYSFLRKLREKIVTYADRIRRWSGICMPFNLTKTFLQNEKSVIGQATVL